MSDPVALCAERLAAGDPDRFAAVMACPAPDRAALFALYAANLAIAQAPWASAEPLVAEMRLQWWIDALGALADQGRPVPQEIGPALELLPAAASARPDRRGRGASCRLSRRGLCRCGAALGLS
ncbi:squalene/phytoene synthase family protein [Rhodobacter capsulatus]|uniref:squalene/phytoene synthase family protein n=1 Tax=Rhodobacter capsulatus TaxID=1061 RepID=UPI004025D8F9